MIFVHFSVDIKVQA